MARARGARRVVARVAFLGMTVAAAFIALSLYVEHRYQHRIVPLAEAPQVKVALVFGAGLARGQEPSPVLAQRLDAAVALYKAGKVQKLLVSGDNSDRFHDETRAMRRYAVEQGVPEADLVGDHAGLSTYDSCVRAKEIFGVTRAILVTQRFHLTRALYIANASGIDAWGVAADERKEAGSTYALRELVTRPVDWALVQAGARPRFLGEKVPIE